MVLKHIILILIMLLWIPIAYAYNIQVLYFYDPLQTLSEEITNGLIDVKNDWIDEVTWLEYNFRDKADRLKFEKYGVAYLPVAVVKCDKKDIKVKRSPDFHIQLNSTIENCYKKLEEGAKQENVEERYGLVEDIKSGIANFTKSVQDFWNLEWSLSFGKLEPNLNLNRELKQLISYSIIFIIIIVVVYVVLRKFTLFPVL